MISTMMIIMGDKSTAIAVNQTREYELEATSSSVFIVVVSFPKATNNVFYKHIIVTMFGHYYSI